MGDTVKVFTRDKIIRGALIGAAAITVSIVALIIFAPHAPRRALLLAGLTGPQSLNTWIEEEIASYPTDGSLRALPAKETNASLGVTQDLYYSGQKMLPGDPGRRSYCIGLMFEVYLKASERYAREKGMPGWQWRDIDLKSFRVFRREFYGVSGNKRTFVDALCARKLGEEIHSLEDARPGDLIQFWRNSGIGHAVIFQSLSFTPAGDPVAINYWSVQNATGVSFSSEVIGEHRSQIDRSRIYIVRPYAP